MKDFTKSVFSLLVVVNLAAGAFPQLSLNPSPFGGSDWIIVVVDSNGDVGKSASIALDKHGYPSIAYLDDTRDVLKYANWTGMNWTKTTVDASGSIGGTISLSLDKNDYPHISYFDGNHNDLKYAKWTGTGWINDTVDSVDSVGWFASMALDTEDRPHISYYDNANHDLKYAKWTGAKWINYTVDSSGKVGYYSSIDVDRNNHAHISYYNASGESLKYAQWTGTKWSIQTVDSSGDVGRYTSIALDELDVPHISYLNMSSFSLKYANFTGNIWNSETVDSVDEVGWHTSIALDHKGHPHMTYHDRFNRELKYANWTGAKWNIEKVDSVSYIYWGTSLALDDENIPHVAYAGFRADHDLKYATKTNLTANKPPVADAGPDQTVSVGDIVQFDGSGSYDLESPLFFSNETIVNDDTNNAKQISPSIAADDFGNVHVLWSDDRSGNLDVFYSVLNETVGNFSPNIRVNDDTGDRLQFASDLDIDLQGTVHALFGDGRNSKIRKDVYYANLTIGSSSFGKNIMVNDDGAGNAYQAPTHIDADSAGNVHAVWWDGRLGVQAFVDVFYAKKVHDQASFSTNVRVNEHIPEYQASPFVLVDDELTVHVVWNDHRDGTGWKIHYSNSTDHGQTYNENVKVNDIDGSFRMRYPELAFGKNGEMAVVWYDERDGGGNIYMSKLEPGQSSFSKNERVNDVLGTVNHSSVAIASDASGKYHIVWQDNRDGNADVYYMFITSDGQFSTSFRVNRIKDAYQRSPSIAVDSDGNPHFVWLSNASGDYDTIYLGSSGQDLKYEWDFGDGHHGTGVKPTHAYDSPGVYDVTLTVTDSMGAKDTDNCTITVLQSGQPPVADAGPDQTVNEGDTVQFDGTGSQGGGGGAGEWVWKAHVPSFRMGGGSATLDDEMYFIGGVESDDGMGKLLVTDTVEKYNPADDAWYEPTSLPEPRSGLGAVAVGGKIYAIGGNNGTNSTDTTFEFDPVTGIWIKRASMPMPLEGFGIATVSDKIYIMGGYSTLIDCYPCGSTYEYDPASDSWTQKTDLPTGRNALAAVALDGKIFALGGDANELMDEVEAYDPVTDTWTTVADMIGPRSHMRAEALGGDIFVMGGYDNLGIPLAVYLYDSSQDNWTVLKAKLAEPRIAPGSGVVSSCIYLFGGHSSHMIGVLSLNEQYCLVTELDYEWDFDASVDSDGDGGYTNDKEATGPTPTHTYYDDGLYVVTLTVTDSQGLQDTDQCNITVLNVAPIPEWTSRSADGTILTPPYPEGKEILFEATVSDPGIYDTFTYDWDFGDGTVLLDAGPNVVHAYGDDKTYTVVLTVTDDDGGVGMDDTPPLPTTNEDPVPKIDLPFCIFVEGSAPCDAIGMFTDPGWLDTHSAAWDFGDGTTETAVLIEKHDPPASTGWNLSSHLYGDNGLFTITFTVTDDDGGKGTATAEVPVQNHPPSFDLYVPITVNEGEQFVLGVEATDPGSDDLAISVDWGDGTSDSRIYYNDGVGPDPPNSGAGVFPFVIQADFTHVYPDDGDYDVTVEVEDDDGGIDVKAFQIPVLNVAPTVTLEVLPIEVNASLRIAGEKWHDVTIEMYEDGALIAGGTLVRYPGSPDDQRLDLTGLQVDYSKTYSAIVRYTPEDDPINGQPNGANPCWIILTFSDGQELWIHHTFNVQHPESYVWEVDLTAAILMHGLTFEATAFDPGADDLTFYWDFGDGTNATSFYSNGNGTYPVTIMDIINHVFPGSGTYVVVLTVEDDDGGIGMASLTIVIY